MKELVEVIAKSLVEHPDEVDCHGDRKRRCSYRRTESSDLPIWERSSEDRDVLQRQSVL